MRPRPQAPGPQTPKPRAFLFLPRPEMQQFKHRCPGVGVFPDAQQRIDGEGAAGVAGRRSAQGHQQHRGGTVNVTGAHQWHRTSHFAVEEQTGGRGRGQAMRERGFEATRSVGCRVHYLESCDRHRVVGHAVEGFDERGTGCEVIAEQQITRAFLASRIGAGLAAVDVPASFERQFPIAVLDGARQVAAGDTQQGFQHEQCDRTEAG